ncbi:MAG: RDD family protein [Actinomycetota bacterium]|nr:RDD family protein [Actinomycetota bacterium]
MAAVVDASSSATGLAAAAPAYLGFVALPSLAPIVVARASLTRLIVVVMMTAVAGTAGALVATSDDAQAGLAVLWVPFVAIPLAAALGVAQRVAERRATAAELEPLVPAKPSDRMAALIIDVATVGAVLVFPLMAMSHAKQEVAAAVVGIGVGTIYMAGLGSSRRRTVGRSILKLAVVDARTLMPCTLAQALLRSVIIVLEVAGAWTIILSPPAIAEFVAVVATGRSLTDRLVRTSVVTESRSG